MFSISKMYVGLEDTALSSSCTIKESKDKKSIDLPIWARDIKNEKGLNMNIEELDRPLFK